MNEIKKENDIFVSTLLNPQSTTNDLIQNGITAENTGLLTQDQYKQSNFVKKQFSDDKGNFNEEAFNNAYLLAAQKYSELTGVKTFSNLEKYIEYSADDIYAPLGAKRQIPTFEISKFKNPYELSYGITSLYGEGKPQKSTRELAQKHKIWDTKNQQWMDKSAEDLNIFQVLFSEPLVYATWDEDGQHFDPSLGMTVSHKKGEWKTDENGEFYTETIGNREGYDKQFVAASDILTREDSWINKIDFFDSDDLNKSVTGTVFKTVATIAPYFVPGGGRFIWGGITAAINLAEVLPTFAKMLDGLINGDNDSEFGKSMTSLENYWKRFDDSYSDTAQGKTFGFEQMAAMVGDIFGQLYQMNAMASLSKLTSLSTTKAEKEAIETFHKKYGKEILEAISKGEFRGNPSDFYQKMIALSPEMKAISAKQSKLAKSLSLGYMALTSSADVYSDALQGGYDRRTAALSALFATAGQYAIMMNNPMGDWFLRTTTGYTDKVNRGLMKKAISPYYQQISESLSKITPATSKAEKEAILSRLFKLPSKGLKSWYNLIKDGSEDFWKRAIIEGTEEVTEEAVMDATKGIFDLFTWLGFGDNRNASFGGFDNVFSKEGALRYLMNALGGFVGGALFEFQGKVLEPALTHQKLPQQVKANLIHEIANGNTEALLQAVDELAKTDSEVFANPITVENQQIQTTSDGVGETRGQVIGKAVKNYILQLNEIINANGLALTDEEVFKKALLTEKVLNALEQSKVIGINAEGRITDLAIADFEELVEDFAKTKLELSSIEKDETKQDLAKKLTKEANEKLKNINDFLSGANSENYLKKALALTNGIIRSGLGNLDIYTYTQGKYNKSFKDFPETGAGTTQQSIREEYNDYINSKEDIRKYLDNLLNSFDLLVQKFSPSFKEYSDGKYSDIRKYVLDNLLSEQSISELISDSKDSSYKEFLRRAVQSLKVRGLSGLTLKETFRVNENVLSDKLLSGVLDSYDTYFKKISELISTTENPVTAENIKDSFKAKLAVELETVPAENIDTNIINNSLLRTNAEFIPIVYESAKNKNIDVNTFLSELGLDQIELSENDEANITKLVIATSPKITTDVQENIGAIVLEEYLNTQPEIDSELLNIYKHLVYLELSKNTYLLQRTAQEIDPRFTIYTEDLDLFKKKLKSGLDNNLSIQEIINDFLLNPEDGIVTQLRKQDTYFQEAELENPDLLDIYVRILNERFSDSNIINAYEKAIKKEIVNNPIYNLLRNLQLELSPSTPTTIFDVLQKESTYLEGLTSIDDYIRQGIDLEQIENAEKIINLAKAIVESMNTTPNDSGTPYGYNFVIRDYIQKYGEKKNIENYQLLDQEPAELILRDLNRISEKLSFIKELNKSNSASKVAEDQNTKKAFTTLMIDKLRSYVGKLTAKGLSIIPEEALDILNDETISESIRLGKAEHIIYKHFATIANKNNIKEIAKDLLLSGEFNGDSIISSNLQTLGLGPNTSGISDYDFLVYLTTILASDQFDFQYNYKKLLGESGDKYPLFIQEYATKIGYSFYKDSLNLHDAIVDALYELYPSKLLVKTKNIYFLNGISGAGKTSVVARNLYKLIEANKVLIAGPNQNQAQKLYDSITDQIEEGIKQNTDITKKENLLKAILTPDAYQKLQLEIRSENLSKNELVKEIEENGKSIYGIDITDSSIFRKDLKTDKLPDVIFIDEITHFNTIELNVLDQLAETYKIKIFTFGDTLQDSAKIIDLPENIDTIFRWQSPRLLSSQRPTNIQKRNNILSLTGKIIELERAGIEYTFGNKLNQWLINSLRVNPIELQYYESDEQFAGDKLVEELSVKDIINIKKISGDKKIGILCELNSDGTIADVDFLNKLKSAGLTESDYELYSPKSFDPNAVQGAEQEYFIINDLNFDDEIITNLIKFYTFITRSLSGSIVKLSDSDKKKLGIDDRKLDYTETYVSPTEIQKDLSKKEKISEINSIIGEGYTPLNQPELPKVPITQPIIDHKKSVDDLEIIQKKNPAPIAIQQTPNAELNPDKKDKLRVYGFYNHLGLINDSDQFFSVSEGTNLDLDGLFGPDQSIDKKIIKGFIKFKNLVTLYPNTASSEFKEGIRNPDIAELFKSINPELETLDEDDIYSWIIDNLIVEDTTYVLGKQMNPQSDMPVYKFGFSANNLVVEGDPILFIGKHISTKDGKLDRFISIGSLPKLETIASWDTPVQSLIDTLTELIEQAKVSFNNGEKLFKLNLNKNLSLLTSGRLVESKSSESFQSLGSMLNSGFIVQELGLITSQKKNGEYTFLKYLKDKFGIDYSWFKSGENLDVSGKYYAVVGFEGSNNQKYKKVIILDSDKVKFDDAIRYIKSSEDETRNLKGRYLSEYSQTQFVLSTLDKLNAYSNKSVLLQYFERLRYKLNKLPNKEKYTRQIQDLDNFVSNFSANPEAITRNDVKSFLESSTMLGIYFIDTYFRNNAGNIQIHNLFKNIYQNISFGEEFGYYNLFPSGGQNSSNGTYALELEESDYNYLGLRGYYLEMPNFALYPEDINIEKNDNQTNPNNVLVEKETNNLVPNEMAIEQDLIENGFENILAIPFNRDENFEEICNIIPQDQLWDYIQINYDEEVPSILNLKPYSEIGQKIKQILDKDSNNDLYCTIE